MPLTEVARIALPEHPPGGGFDHAAVDPRRSRLYVAHTSLDRVEVIDLNAKRWVASIPNLPGVAGVWVDEAARRLFTSNRGEDSASVFDLDNHDELWRIPTGARPNGMAFDRQRGILLVAGVGNPKLPDAPPSLTFIDADEGEAVGRLRATGRTRWATYHRDTDSYYANIADPAGVAVVEARDTSRLGRVIPVPARGPHGLEQDPSGERLFVACDDGNLVSVDLPSGTAEPIGRLAGPPDVLWFNHQRNHLYCAVGDPGVVEVFGLAPWRHLETVKTAPGAGTLTLDPERNEVHCFLPGSHEDLVLHDR